MELQFYLIVPLLILIGREEGLVHSSLTVVSQSNLFSPSQFGRQIDLSSVLSTNESFIINYEEGYFLCPKEPRSFPKRFRLSRICDGLPDCAQGSDELFRELKCAEDCDPGCSPHGLCMRASALDPKGHCRCDDGYGGSDCSFPNVNECKYRPCGMSAECVDKVDGYECKCLPGFQGDGTNCVTVEDVLANVKNVLKSDSSQFKDPNIDLASFNAPATPRTDNYTTVVSSTTEASPKPLSIILPVSPTDVVDKVKEILGNTVHQLSSPQSTPLVTPSLESIPRISDPYFNRTETPYEISSTTQKSSQSLNVRRTSPRPTSKTFTTSKHTQNLNVRRTSPRPTSKIFTTSKATQNLNVRITSPRPTSKIFTTPDPLEEDTSLRLTLQEEELFLKELNLIEPQISREDPRLRACRDQFQKCSDPRDSCMKDLQSCSLSVLDVRGGPRGHLWGECIMDHHMCIMNQEPFCMKGFQKCSFAAIEVLKHMLPRKPYSENIEEAKSPRLRIQNPGEGPFTLSFHFRVCVNGYLDCLEGSERSTLDCKSEFDGCSLRLLNASRGALTVRTQVTIPGLSECIQLFVECIEAEGFTCYGDYNKCTVEALDDYTSTHPSTDIKTTTAYKKTTIKAGGSGSRSTTIRTPFNSGTGLTKDPDEGSNVLDICKEFGAPNKFGSFSGRPAVSTVDCVWDYFSCTKRYGQYPQNKACCDGRFKLCCDHIMNGGHGSVGGSFDSITTTTEATSKQPNPDRDDCSRKLNECSRRGLKSERQCKLEFNQCSSSSGITTDPSTQRPIHDIDLPLLPGFVNPASSSTIKPIQDIDIPQNQEFLLQNGEVDPYPSLVGQGQTQVIRADEEFMACLLEQFECTEDCPPLKRCSELAGVDSLGSDNFVSGSGDSSQEFFLPPVNFSLIGSGLLSSAEDKERMFCVREFFACNGPSENCKLNFKACVAQQESFSLEDLCRGVAGSPENYLVPHPLDCTKFYSCQSLGPGLGYRPHLMDCPFSTGFDVKLKICNFIQSLPRCRGRQKGGSSRSARLLSGHLARIERSGAQAGEVAFLTSFQPSSSPHKVPPSIPYILLLIVASHTLIRHS